MWSDCVTFIIKARQGKSLDVWKTGENVWAVRVLRDPGGMAGLTGLIRADMAPEKEHPRGERPVTEVSWSQHLKASASDCQEDLCEGLHRS